jgi:acyl carrier protein
MIDEKLKSILSEVLEVPEASITSETSSQQVESWDSIRHLELMLAIEHAYGVQFQAEQITSLTSAGEIQAILRALRANQI